MAFVPAFFLTARYSGTHSKPSDLRDAPISNSALDQLDLGNFNNAAPLPVPYTPQPEQRSMGVSNWIARTKIKPLTPRKWTIMVFMNGKNNLKDAMFTDVNMMEAIGSDKNINIVAELGRSRGLALKTDLYNWNESRRLYITKDDNAKKITSKTLMGNGRADMGDYRRVVDFVKWAKTNFPADKYMLVISGHGLGWMDPKPAGKGVSFDDRTNNYIRTREMGRLLQESGKVDILTFDACLMQTGEVAAEIGNKVSYILGSEEVVPGLGLPYHILLGILAQRPDMSALDFSSIITLSYTKFYQQYVKGVLFSAVRADKIDGFHRLVRKFTTLAIETSDTAALTAARDGVLRMDIPLFGDLYNFLELYSANMKKQDARISSAIRDLQKYIKEELIAVNSYFGVNSKGRNYQDGHGVSLYIPYAPADGVNNVPISEVEARFEAPYTDFAFTRSTGWYELVSLMSTLPSAGQKRGQHTPLQNTLLQ